MLRTIVIGASAVPNSADTDPQKMIKQSIYTTEQNDLTCRINTEIPIKQIQKRPLSCDRSLLILADN